MAKVELNKSIEARKLNQRTGLPETGPEVTIPYGAIIEHVETDRDREKFQYLRDLYSCSHEVFVSAVNLSAPAAPAEPAAVPSKAKLQWEHFDSFQRAKVPGGWLVVVFNAGLTFYPDPKHRWDGSSVA